MYFLDAPFKNQVEKDFISYGTVDKHRDNQVNVLSKVLLRISIHKLAKSSLFSLSTITVTLQRYY